MGSIRDLLMEESHKTMYYIHPGSTKMYLDLKRYYWWLRMKIDVATYVAECMTCSRVKAQHQKLYGTLEPLPTPMCKWDDITKYFITKLPKMKKARHDLGCSRPVNEECTLLSRTITWSVEMLAETYVYEIVKIHDVPLSIVSDKDIRFTSRF